MAGNALVERARDVIARAYAKSAGFGVGAVLRASDRSVCTGRNARNASYGGSWRGRALLVVISPLFWAGCQEITPTSVDPTLLPGEPVTVEILVPWAEFGSNLEVFGGYGAPQEIGIGVVARAFAGTLDARTLVRHGAFPLAASVRDTTGTTRTDSVLTFVGGRVVARFDTATSTNLGAVELVLGSTQVEWHAATATWTTAVDTLNDTRAWPEAGAGPVIMLDSATWDPAAGDSTWFDLDSATVAAFADTTNLARGMRLELITPDVRLEVRTLDLQLVTRPSLNPDTLIMLSVQRVAMTFVYDPLPVPPPDGIRVGGVPAWRTVFDVAIPDTLTGPAELCGAVGCPVRLEPGWLNYAALLIKTRQSAAAFQPTDTVRLDVRTVLSRAALPKSPLGPSLVGGLGRELAPELFGSSAGTEVEVPFTEFARDLLRGETASGGVPSRSLALLEIFEPRSIAFASFHGPGGPDAPVLRLLVTVGGSVEIP